MSVEPIIVTISFAAASAFWSFSVGAEPEKSQMDSSQPAFINTDESEKSDMSVLPPPALRSSPTAFSCPVETEFQKVFLKYVPLSASPTSPPVLLFPVTVPVA